MESKVHIGSRFGRLTVVDYAEDRVSSSGRHRRMWVCLCDCGKRKTIYGESLTRGATISCGCYQKERASEARTTHGKANTRLYVVWCSMKSRCFCETEPAYRLYGARGISMCDEWKNDFLAFEKWAFENGYDESAPRGECTIDRIDNNKGYCPENCRWVPQVVQMNNVSYNHRVEHNGENKTIAEWAREFNTPYSKFEWLLVKHNYNIEKIKELYYN